MPPRASFFSQMLPLLCLGLAATASPALATETHIPSLASPVTLLPEAWWTPSMDLAEPLALALAERRYGEALPLLQAIQSRDLAGAQVGDHAFLLAWSLVRTDRAAEALPLLELIARSENAPAPYVHLTRGEILLAADRPVEAAQELAQVDRLARIWPRARLAEAQALHEAGRTADSLALYEELAARPDPAAGNEVALLALARRAGTDSPEARPYLSRLYRHYPRSREGAEATKLLGERASLGDKAWRADTLMEAWGFDGAVELLSPVLDAYTTPSADACVAWYAYGRSQFKRNNVSIAAELLEPVGRKCKGHDDDRGAKSLYVAGKSLERKKDWAGAARAYAQIPELYPSHSMADDGYALGGVAWQQAGRDDLALALWTRQAEAPTPPGDLAAEGFWRLAWTAYLQGDTAGAIAWAEKMVATVPLQTDPVHVQAALYWSARWRVHPDYDHPDARNPDAAAVARGIQELAALCRAHPFSFYSILAAARLAELAPEQLAAIPRPAALPALGGWNVRTEWLDDPNTGWGLALARLGLVKDALSELGSRPPESLLPSEYAVQAEIEEATDPHGAHDRLHHYLLQHPPSTLGADRDRMIEQAYPDLYWAEVQVAAQGYAYDPRIFHALVREESGFNKEIKSHAGARGLSQLMPATALAVGRKLGLNATTDKLSDPLLNLRIGSRYYNDLVSRFDGNLFLSTAAYNAGEGNVEKWLAARPGRPTDEFVESIPLRETRHYVKRVMGTWQVYRAHYDQGPLFYDLSAFNHLARTDG